MQSSPPEACTQVGVTPSFWAQGISLCAGGTHCGKTWPPGEMWVSWPESKGKSTKQWPSSEGGQAWDTPPHPLSLHLHSGWSYFLLLFLTKIYFRSNGWYLWKYVSASMEFRRSLFPMQLHWEYKFIRETHTFLRISGNFEEILAASGLAVVSEAERFPQIPILPSQFGRTEASLSISPPLCCFSIFVMLKLRHQKVINKRKNMPEN